LHLLDDERRRSAPQLGLLTVAQPHCAEGRVHNRGRRAVTLIATRG